MRITRTGKTTVSLNLALVLKSNDIDCDVEEPNGFLFLKPIIDKTEKALVGYHVMDDNKCISCGACEILCKYDTIIYKERETGKIESGKIRDISCSRRILNIGEPMEVPIIRQLLKNLSRS